MNPRKENIEFDEEIGSQDKISLTKDDQELIKIHRKRILQDRSEEDRIKRYFNGFSLFPDELFRYSRFH